ncbi:PD40 domain-containing protein [Moraxella osloensis]|uniref:Translocation protein TolB n=1 Tax=Faucicola osloensis TaxID=34062 RepID=A0A378QE26_FAUOS|nr:PD40 domain-containing protein [Moraxella osloensis]QPT41872.1 PD40 domain-containing protein [Moraxella osloensis]STY97467.1 translocation protein TolB [Moraxella osloensis]
MAIVMAIVMAISLAMTGCQTMRSPSTTLSSNNTLQGSTSLPKVIEAVPTNLPHMDARQLSGKLIFIYLTGFGENRQAQLIETQIDGSDPKTLYKVNGTIMSLSASRLGDRLIFTVQAGNSYPQVVILDRATLQVTEISAVSGRRTHNFSGAISPDGRQLLLANSQMGNPEIFLTDSSGNVKQQLTHQPAIDLAPVWLPDGQSFIFTSDKAKFLQPQLYQYYFAKQQFLPLNLPGKTNAIARISPTGRLITYVSDNSQGRLADMATKKSIAINNEGLAEPANFSPDGNYLLYSAKNRIKIIPVPTFETLTPQQSPASWTIEFADSNHQPFTIREPIWVTP